MFDFCISIEVHAPPTSEWGSTFLHPFQPPQAAHAYTGMIPRAFFRFKVEVEDLTTNVATSTADPRGSGMWWASKQRTSLPIVRELLESYIFFQYCHYSIIGAGFIGMPGMKCWCDFANHLGPRVGETFPPLPSQCTSSTSPTRWVKGQQTGRPEEGRGFQGFFLRFICTSWWGFLELPPRLGDRSRHTLTCDPQ